MINKILICTFVFLFLSNKSAFAYLDPGTGSIIIQAIIGVFLAGAITFRTWFGKLKNFIQNIKNKRHRKNEK